ncbi:MAG: hypothetical protein ACE3JP_16890 [Ectobacillus sp.]
MLRNFNRQMNSVKTLGMKFHESDRMEELKQIVDEVLGYNEKITQCKPHQIKKLRKVYFKLKKAY